MVNQKHFGIFSVQSVDVEKLISVMNSKILGSKITISKTALPSSVTSKKSKKSDLTRCWVSRRASSLVS